MYLQWAVGHALCSSCSNKLKNARKCHMCRVAMPDGYPGAELQGGPCGPWTTLRSAQPKPIGRVRTRSVAQDLPAAAASSSPIVLFAFLLSRGVRCNCGVLGSVDGRDATAAGGEHQSAIAHRTLTSASPRWQTQSSSLAGTLNPSDSKTELLSQR